MNKLKKSIAASLLLVLAGSVFAMGDGKGMKGNMPTFSDVDLNGDGKITEQEFGEFHAKRMTRMAEEGRKMKHAGSMPAFSDIDTNGDGGIDEKEFATHQAEHHAEMQKHKAQSASEK